MPSSRPEKTDRPGRRVGREARNFGQLGLDFTPVPAYSNLPRKEIVPMNHELFESLDSKVSDLVEKYRALKEENSRLSEEIEQLKAERQGFGSRIDAILGKLDGI